MTKFDDIYEAAVDSYGLITSTEARGLGVTNNELVQYARRGRLEHLGYGVYRLARRVPTRLDPYAATVALVGEEAYLFGESVLAMLELAPTDPTRLFVACPRRVRRRLPPSVQVVARRGGEVTSYEGIPSQPLPEAIRSARARMMDERLVEAAGEARSRGLIASRDYEALLAELGTRRG